MVGGGASEEAAGRGRRIEKILEVYNMEDVP